MNKKKSAHLWIIAVLKKLLMIWWDMWQFCNNKALHSPTGPTLIASHNPLNYQINKEKCIGTAGIDCSNYYHLFSKQYTITKLQSSNTPDKKLWLYEVSLAYKEYVGPDEAVTRQAISMCITRCNPSWSPTAHSSLLPHKIDPLLPRTIIPPMKNNM